MGRLKAVTFFLLVALPLRLRADLKSGALEVTYLGNEGFLVRSGSQAVLFDALFGSGLPDYDHVPANVVHDMEAGRPPFDKISLVFISHIHPDHFELTSTARFLKSHPSTIVVGPAEISQPLRRAFAGNRQMSSQIRTVSGERGRIVTRKECDVQIGIFPLSHGNVENLAYLVLLNGRQLLHVGDADLPMNDLAQLKLFAHGIDLAFIPFWQLTENAECVRDQIRAKVIVPMHMIRYPTAATSREYLNHIGGVGGMLAKIHSEFPNAVFFRTPLETKIF